MKVLSMRYCTVESEASELQSFFDKLGLPRKSSAVSDASGAIYSAGESWIEVWQEGPDMPAGLMLQIIVDDADAFAHHAQANGLAPHGPVHAHGEKMYFLTSPSGLNVTIQAQENS